MKTRAEIEAATTVENVANAIKARNCRGAWASGVKKYALELLAKLEENVSGGYEDIDSLTQANGLKRALLDGAKNWKQYSEGGCALVYNADIAERLCNASELKKTNHGLKDPNGRETWIDCQARALYQAYLMIEDAFRTTR